MLIDKVIESMLGEDVETITEFLGYKPDDEILNNNQLLKEKLNNVAKQMPDDILMQFYEKSQEKLRIEAEKNYCLQTIEELLLAAFFILSIIFWIICTFVPVLDGILTVILLIIGSALISLIVVSVLNSNQNKDHGRR